MYADTTNEPRGIEEAYSSATHTSNLRLETREDAPRRSVDEIVAAGWNHSRIGMALLRVHSEWDGAEKPAKPKPEAIAALAASYRPVVRGQVEMRVEGGKTEWVRPEVYARKQAAQWFLHEQMLLFQKLKTLPEVRSQLIAWAARAGMAGGEHKVPAVIGWWLDQTCPACDGQKYRVIPGTARLSDRPCEKCHGSGEAYLPHGQDGRKMLRFLSDCLSAARASMRGRFQHQQPKGKT